MEPATLQALLPALTIAALAFRSLMRSGPASALATAAAVGALAYLLLARLSAGVQELAFIAAAAVLAAGLARPYVKGTKDPHQRNLRWLLALALTLAFVLMLDGWVYGGGPQ
ncbi:hypothetical protein [Oceanithermus sp.]